MNLKNIMTKLYYNNIIGKVFHTTDYCIRNALRECRTVLDLGCGPNSPLQRCENIQFSVGVEGYKPYLEQSMRKGIHSKYILGNILKQCFTEESFDAVMMLEVLEHLDKGDGIKLLNTIEQWASKVIIISTPNGFLPQKVIDENQYQMHRSGWSTAEIQGRGYKAYGLSGLKLLRTERVEGEEHDTIKFRPKIFWLIVSALLQIIVYFIPSLAFEVLYIKVLQGKKTV